METANRGEQSLFNAIKRYFQSIYRSVQEITGIRISPEIDHFFKQMTGVERIADANTSVETLRAEGINPDDLYFQQANSYDAQGKARTDTPEFKAWFGNSKVVDENGAPLVVYHGTEAGFDRFSKEMIGTSHDMGFYGAGFYFTASKEVAGMYGEKQLPVYLKMENPLVLTEYIGGSYNGINNNLFEKGGDFLEKIGILDSFSKEKLKKYKKIKKDFIDSVTYEKVLAYDKNGKEVEVWSAESKFKDWRGKPFFEKAYDTNNYAGLLEKEDKKENALNRLWWEYSKSLSEAPVKLIDNLGLSDYVRNNISSEELTDAAKDFGYDGIIAGDEYIVFEPTQIKSVYNRGTWDADNPNIYYQHGRIGEEAQTDAYGNRVIVRNGYTEVLPGAAKRSKQYTRQVHLLSSAAARLGERIEPVSLQPGRTDLKGIKKNEFARMIFQTLHPVEGRYYAGDGNTFMALVSAGDADKIFYTSKTFSDDAFKDANKEIALHLNEILPHAVLVKEHADLEGRPEFSVKRYMAAVQYQGDVYAVKLTVKEFTRKREVFSQRVYEQNGGKDFGQYNLEIVKKLTLHPTGAGSENPLRSDQGSINNITKKDEKNKPLYSLRELLAGVSDASGDYLPSEGQTFYQRGRGTGADMFAPQPIDLTDKIGALEGKTNKEIANSIEKELNGLIGEQLNTASAPLQIQITEGNKPHIKNANVPLNRGQRKRHAAALQSLRDIVQVAQRTDRDGRVDLSHNKGKTLRHKQNVEEYVYFSAPVQINTENGPVFYDVELHTERIKGQDPNLLDLYHVRVKRNLPNAGLTALRGDNNSIGNNGTVVKPENLLQDDSVLREKEQAAKRQLYQTMRAQQTGAQAADNRPSDEQIEKDLATIRANGIEKYERESRIGFSLGNFAKDIVLTIRQRAGAVDKRLKAFFDKLDYFEANIERFFASQTQGFFKKYKALSETDKDLFDYYAYNQLKERLRAFVKEKGMEKEYQQVRHVLDFIYAVSNRAGIDMGYIEEYFPTSLVDYAGFMDHMRGTDKWTYIEKSLREMDPDGLMSEKERADAVNKIIRGYDRTDPVSKPSGAKERKILYKSPELMRFYERSDKALMKYLSSMGRAIAINRAYGKGMGFNTDETIGAIVLDLINTGTITRAEETEIKSLLKSRLSYSNTPAFVVFAKNIGYLQTMNNFTSAITQLGDLYAPIYKYGFGTAIEAMFGKTEITRKDLGLDKIWEEFSDKSKTGAAVDKLFKVIGLNAMDGFGKKVAINASLINLRKQAQAGSEALLERLSYTFGKEAGTVLKDIKAGRVTTKVKILAWADLADTQPIGKSGMPAAYWNSPHGRLFYQLKTYTTNQMSLFYADCILNIKKGIKHRDKKTFLKGVQNLFKLMILLTAGNATGDVLKNLIMGRHIDVSDVVVSNLLWNIGLSKYTFYQGKRMGYATALWNSFVLPPMLSSFDSMYREVGQLSKGKKELKDTYAVTYFPFGRAYYWWYGGGRTQEREDAKERR